MPIFNRITYSPVETSEAYAVFDSSDESFTFFRDAKGKYTDGQVSETKTYYTGFEDITGNTAPSWYDSRNYEQKNEIKTVAFKDKIQPKTCYGWFANANSLTSITGLDKLDTAAMTDMSWMFSNCSSLTSLDLSSFNTENVTNMSSMFQGCESLTSLDVSSFSTAKVTNMSWMFNYCKSLTSLDLSSFNTAAVTNMDFMFKECRSLTGLDVSSFNTKNVTNMNQMFSGCNSLTSLDVSSFSTAKVTNMSAMFWSCSKLKTIYASSLFTTDAVSSPYNMFRYCTSLVGGAGTKYDSSHTDAVYARIDGGTSRPGYFTERDPRQAYAVYDSGDQSMTFFRDDKGKYTDGQVSGTKTYYTGFEDITGTTTPSWFNLSNYRQKNTIKTVAFKDKIRPKTCYRWFSDANSLASITGLDKLNTSAVTNMDFMFYSCRGLTSLDLSSFNTENVTNMNQMFGYCKNLTDLDLSSFNTSAVTKMTSMFRSCNNLTGLDLSSFNTENVTSMIFMFNSCSKLTSLDVSSFNTAKVTNVSYMFDSCSKLKTIYASSLFTTDAVSSSDYMFGNCDSLTGGAGTKYNASHTDKTYARIDGGTSRPGYFTAK